MREEAEVRRVAPQLTPLRATADWSLGRWGGRGMLAVALLATVLMAIGALLDT